MHTSLRLTSHGSLTLSMVSVHENLLAIAWRGASSHWPLKGVNGTALTQWLKNCVEEIVLEVAVRQLRNGSSIQQIDCGAFETSLFGPCK